MVLEMTTPQQPEGVHIEYVDGVEVNPLTISVDGEISNHRGGVIVQPDVNLIVRGQHQGSLHVRQGAHVEIAGRHQGSLHLDTGATVTVTGSQQGSSHLEVGSLLEVSAHATLQGSIHNAGTVHNRGTRGGSVSGSGEIADLAGSRVVQPVLEGGTWVYRW